MDSSTFKDSDSDGGWGDQLQKVINEMVKPSRAGSSYLHNGLEQKSTTRILALMVKAVG